MAYKTPVVVELYYAGAWHNISALGHVAARPAITITRGRPDETQQAAPSKCTLALLNADARYSPRNPSSPLYGLIGRNTLIRVSVTGYGVRFVGEIESWPQTWDIQGKVAIVPITAYGVTRRLGAGASNTPVKSAQRRYYDTVSPAPVALWPLESGDRRGALSFPSGLAGGPDMTVVASTAFGVTRPFSAAGGVTPGPPGAASATDTSAGGRLSGVVPAVVGATTARAEFSMLADGYENTFPGLIYLYNAIASSDGRQTRIGVVAQDNGSGWQVGVDWTGPSGSGAVYAPGVRVLQDKQWHLIQLDISSAGGGANTAYELRVDGVSVLTGTAVGHPWSPVNRVDTNILATDVDQQAFVAVWSGASLPSAAGSYSAFTAYPGETVAARLARLGTEDGILTTVVGSAATLIGPQPVATAMGLRQDCVDVDGGILVENRADTGLTYIALSALYNQTVSATLDYAAKEVAPPLLPTDDTRYVANDVTVTRKTNGAAANAVRRTGPLNVQEPAADPEGVGLYQKDYPLNLAADVQATQQAAWKLHVGTFDDPRYPSVAINLTRLHEDGKTALMAQVAALDVASRLEVANPPAWQGPDRLSQRLQGYGEVIGTHAWTLTANTSPARPYDVMKLAAAAPDLSVFLGRYAGDPDCAIRGDLTTSATSIPLDPNFTRWTTTAAKLNPANYPAMQLRLRKAPGIDGGGELVTVSAMATTAAAYVAAGAAAHANNAAVTPALYAGDALNDWSLVVGATRGAGTIATPAGYVLLAQVGKLYLWARIRGAASPGNPTLTPSGGAAGDTVSGVTLGLRNMPITLALARYLLSGASQQQSNASAQNMAYPGRFDPGIYPGAVQLLIARKSATWTDVSPPAGFTEAVDAPSGVVGSGQGIWVGYRIDTTPAIVTADALTVTGGAAAVSDVMLVTLVGGYQTATVTRSANGVVKAHTAGTRLALEHPMTWGR